MAANRNEALYQLGVLYRAKFKENELAIQRLERMLASNPTSEIEAAALYELQKNYTDTHNSKAEATKSRLLANYPNTDYANFCEEEKLPSMNATKLLKWLWIALLLSIIEVNL